MIHAVTVFIVPTVGAIAFGWFWRHQRARARSRYDEKMRETRRQLPIELRATKTGGPFSILRLTSALPPLLMRRTYFDCIG